MKKSRESRLRLQRFEVDTKNQKVADLESMIADFRRMMDDLDRQIELEQNRAGITDVNHFAYPTFAKAARQRRDNLARSVEELEARLVQARQEHADALEALEKATQKSESGRDQMRERAMAGSAFSPAPANGGGRY